MIHTTAPTKADDIRQMCRASIELMDRLDHFKPQIMAAMRHGVYTHSYDDIIDMVATKHLVPRFYGDDSFALITINTFPKAKHFHLFIAGGNLDTIVAHGPQIIAEAKAAGCTRVTLNGRKGWERVTEKLGAKRAYTMMTLEVE